MRCAFRAQKLFGVKCFWCKSCLVYSERGFLSDEKVCKSVGGAKAFMLDNLALNHHAKTQRSNDIDRATVSSNKIMATACVHSIGNFDPLTRRCLRSETSAPGSPGYYLYL